MDDGFWMIIDCKYGILMNIMDDHVCLWMIMVCVHPDSGIISDSNKAHEPTGMGNSQWTGGGCDILVPSQKISQAG